MITPKMKIPGGRRHPHYRHNDHHQHCHHNYQKVRVKKLFLGIFPKPVGPPPLGTFRNKNVTFGQKKSGFQGQKQLPP